MPDDPIFQPLQFRNLTVKNRRFPFQYRGPIRQLRWVGKSGSHQLGTKVSPKEASGRSFRRSYPSIFEGASFPTTPRSTATTASRSGESWGAAFTSTTADSSCNSATPAASATSVGLSSEE